MSSFFQFLFPHLYSVPYYVIWLGGIVYAIVYRQRHPRASLFAGMALGLMLAVNLTSTILNSYFQYQMINDHASVTEFGQQMRMLSLCSIPIGMAAWLMLLFATFGRENRTESGSNSQDIA